MRAKIYLKNYLKYSAIGGCVGGLAGALLGFLCLPISMQDNLMLQYLKHKNSEHKNKDSMSTFFPSYELAIRQAMLSWLCCAGVCAAIGAAPVTYPAYKFYQLASEKIPLPFSDSEVNCKLSK
ncbi:MAG: hypothetical protein NTU49_00245 [Gammaproteobacteria bacterium]|nr:hypothetical protein [Gammaproteobacteria bacterium]